VLFHKDILRVLRATHKEGVVLSVDFNKKLGEEEMKVIIENNVVIEISKEISPNEADGEYIGLAKVGRNYSRTFFEFIERTIKEKGKQVFYEEAFQMMIDGGYMLQYEGTRGLPWIEIDTPEDLRIAREMIAPRIMKKSYSHANGF
jgi:choline kinase